MADRSRWLRGVPGETTDGLFVVDNQHRIVLWNGGAERLLGHTAADVLGRPCHEILDGHGSDGEPLCGPGCPVRRCVGRGELPGSMEMRALTKDGRRIWLHLSVIVIPNEPRPFLAHVFHDVSGGKRAARAISEVASVLMANGGLQVAHGEAISSLGPEQEGLAPPKVASLFTKREQEVLRSMATGLSNAAIAERLGVSRFTIRSHVQHILAKAGVHSRAEAIAFAFRAHLL